MNDPLTEAGNGEVLMTSNNDRRVPDGGPAETRFPEFGL
jgi:hypothetical protein